MRIEVFTGGPFETNSYLLISENKQALLIDPTFNSSTFFFNQVEKQGLKPLAILLTHSHFDHIAEVAEVKRELNIPVYIHALDSPNLVVPGTDGLPFGEEIQGVKPDHFLEEGQVIHLGDFHLIVLHTPGHSAGSVCFYFPDHAMLISGDTLFKGTYGNVSFPTSDAKLMKDSLKKLSKLPIETTIWPGHGDPSTIGSEDWLLQQNY